MDICRWWWWWLVDVPRVVCHWWLEKWWTFQFAATCRQPCAIVCTSIAFIYDKGVASSTMQRTALIEGSRNTTCNRMVWTKAKITTWKCHSTLHALNANPFPVAVSQFAGQEQNVQSASQSVSWSVRVRVRARNGQIVCAPSIIWPDFYEFLLMRFCIGNSLKRLFRNQYFQAAAVLGWEYSGPLIVCPDGLMGGWRWLVGHMCKLITAGDGRTDATSQIVTNYQRLRAGLCWFNPQSLWLFLNCPNSPI